MVYSNVLRAFDNNICINKGTSINKISQPEDVPFLQHLYSYPLDILHIKFCKFHGISFYNTTQLMSCVRGPRKKIENNTSKCQNPNASN